MPPEEWHRLGHTPLDAIWRDLDPQESAIVVVETEGQVVACWSLVKFWHVEGVWIAPSHQKRAGVARRLLDAMKALLRSRGARAVMTGAESPDVRHLLISHLKALPLPEQFVWRLEPGDVANADIYSSRDDDHGRRDDGRAGLRSAERE